MVLILFVNITCAQKSLTNQQWATQVWLSLLDSLSGQAGLDADSLGLLVLDGAQGKSFLLEGAFARHFTSGGRQIALRRHGLTFVVQQVDFQAQYRPLTSTWLGFNRRYERYLSLHIQGWLEKNPAKNVLLLFNSRHAQRDTLDKDTLEQNEQNAYPAFRGSWRAHTFWARFMEPAVVVLASLTAIYLFFSMRS